MNSPHAVAQNPDLEQSDESRYSGWPLLVARERRRKKMAATKKARDVRSSAGICGKCAINSAPILRFTIMGIQSHHPRPTVQFTKNLNSWKAYGFCTPSLTPRPQDFLTTIS